MTLSIDSDARRLYAFADDDSQNRQVMYVYDVSGPPVGGQFPQLAQFVMPGALPSDSVHSTRGVVTPDGRTLATWWAYPNGLLH